MHVRAWASSAHRDARRIVVERCARSRHPSSFPFAFASSLSLSLSLSRSLARAMTRGEPSASRLDDPSTRDARARRSSAMHERLTNDGGALCQPCVSTQMRARDATTPLRAMTNADDARMPTPPRGASKKGASSSSSSSSNDGSMSRSCRFFRLVSFPRTDRPFLAARETGGLSKSRVVVESDGFTYKKRKSTKGVVGVTIAEPLWNGRGKDARALVRVNASNASAMSSGEARGREDFHEKLPNDMPEDERMQLLCESVCEAECGSVVPQLKGENAFAANAISEALQEFQLRVEQLLIDEEVKFEEGPQGVAAKIEARKRELRALRDALEQESTQWSCMLEGSAKTVTAESPAIDTSELGPSEAGSLVEACADTHRRLLLQTEGARGLVEGVESLCVRAERACDVFAGAIASNDFRSLPSYQSPHRLISGLIGGGV